MSYYPDYSELDVWQENLRNGRGVIYEGCATVRSDWSDSDHDCPAQCKSNRSSKASFAKARIYLEPWGTRKRAICLGTSPFPYLQSLTQSVRLSYLDPTKYLLRIEDYYGLQVDVPERQSAAHENY